MVIVLRRARQGCGAANQVGFPVELVPISKQQLAVLKFGFPFLTPVGAQSAWHDHAEPTDQPEPETKARCYPRTRHRFTCCLFPATSAEQFSDQSAVVRAAFRQGFPSVRFDFAVSRWIARARRSFALSRFWNRQI